MVQQIIRKNSSWSPPARKKSSSVAPRPFDIQAQQNLHKPLVQRATGSDTFSQNVESAARLGHHFADISIQPPETQVSAPVQRKQVTDDQPATSTEQRPNQTGLPDHLKAGIENLSSFSLDNVKVHYNSDKPAQLNALAYTQGADIHVASGQEKHLAHEAWHVVQQAQGRVQPTMRMSKHSGDPDSSGKDGVPVNDDKGLEREADVMGGKALQRAAINSSEAGGTEPESTIGAGVTIQRKIGFEFETTDYLPKINVPPLRPATRKEELHQGTKFKLEGDDSTGAGSPSIEFVTSAYEISKTGVSDCKTSFTEINSILKRIEKFKKHDVITGLQHQLTNQSAELTRQEDHKATFKMQITQGVSLEDLPTVMKYFGTNVPGETPKEAKQRAQSRRLMVGTETGSREETDLLGRAPSLAQTAIDYLYSQRHTLGISLADATHFQGSQPRLLGFLAQIMMYVKGLTIPANQLMKYKIPFLGRIEFGALFGELSADHRRILAQGNASALTSAVVHAANSVTLWPGHDVNFASNSPLLRTANIITGDNIVAPKTKVPVMQSLTIEAWLRGITIGIDWLSASSMDIWLTHLEAGLDNAGRKERTDLLESFNMLGDNVGVATDPTDRLGTSGLSVLENRAISPGGRFMTIDQVETAAKANFEFLLNMKEKAGAPGKFPKVKVPK